jgi:hypothetical protein
MIGVHPGMKVILFGATGMVARAGFAKPVLESADINAL